MKCKLDILSGHEIKVLALWLCGETAKQTAAYLGKSYRTVESQRERIKFKLGIYQISELRHNALASNEIEAIFQLGKKLIRNASQEDLTIKQISIKPSHEDSGSRRILVH